MLAVLGQFLADAEPKGCDREGMDSFLRIEFSVPILPTDEDWERSKALFGFLVLRKDERDGVVLTLNVAQYELLTERMSREFPMGPMELRDATIRALVVNDLREPQGFTTWDAFVDGEPFDRDTTFEIERRRRAEIVISNVSAAHLAKHGHTPVSVGLHAS